MGEGRVGYDAKKVAEEFGDRVCYGVTAGGPGLLGGGEQDGGGGDSWLLLEVEWAHYVVQAGRVIWGTVVGGVGDDGSGVGYKLLACSSGTCCCGCVMIHVCPWCRNGETVAPAQLEI